jgi:hypothetical protein
MTSRVYCALIDWRGVRTGWVPSVSRDVHFSPPRTMSLCLIRLDQARETG